MFIDHVKIKVISGKGGNGALTWRREKFVAFGGPDGGDGGHGGSIYLQASKDLSTLLDFRLRSAYKAEAGVKGSRKNCHGKRGEDIIIKVPCGTIVSDPNNNIIIADLIKEGEQVLVAEGGRGGKGNARFKTQRNTVPYICEPGEPGIERELVLELKMIADIGIIGFPNAGKSTLISQISAAKPKIADYAFTTLQPNLGVVHKENGDGFVVADIPGLIEGASEGIGLGHEFLRHIERTKLLVHVVDVWGLISSNKIDAKKFGDISLDSFEDPVENYKKLNHELTNYSSALSQKPQILVLNKVEAYPEEELQELLERFTEELLKNKPKTPFDEHDEISAPAFFTISAATGEGVNELKRYLCQAVDLVQEEGLKVEVEFDSVAQDHDDSEFTIEQPEMNYWAIHCRKLERFMKITNLRERESLHHLFWVAKSMGVFEALKTKGAKIGDTLDIDGVKFDIDETVLL